SVEVLKDASTTAIYGAAGTNGVIIVTTKQAEAGKLKVELNSYYGVNSSPTYPSALKGQEWLDYLEAGFEGAYDRPSADRNELLTTYSLIPGRLSPYIDNGKWVDWVDETLQTGIQQNHSVSIRGGTEKTQGYFSLGYNSEKGIYKNDKTEIFTARTGVTHNFDTWMSAGIQTSLSWRDRDYTSSRINRTYRTVPLGDVYDNDGNINIHPIEGDDNTVSLLADFVDGVYINNGKQLRVTANPFIEIKPITGLSFKSILGTTLSASRTGNFESENTYSNLTAGGVGTKTASYSTALGYSYTWDNILNYNFKVAYDHDLTITGISSWTNSQNENSWAYNEGFDYDKYEYFNLGAGINPNVTSEYYHTKKMSFAGRVNYSYRGKYLATLSNRWDGASQLYDKWHSFPAGAVAWRISDEAFMDGAYNWLSNLKLRAGYGVTGNANIRPYVNTTMMTNSPNNLWLGSSQAPVYIPTEAVGNRNLVWEKSYSTNIGVDLGLFNGRVELIAEVYNTDTKDVLYARPLPSSSGAFTGKKPYTMTSNVAKMNNKGIEFTLNTRNIATRDFKWNSTVTFAQNKEKVKSIDLGSNIETDELIALGLFLGHPQNTIYGYKKLGIWQLDEAAEAAKYGREPGQVKIETLEIFDENGVGDEGYHPYSTNDKQILGAETPDWTLGFQNTFYWKNFDLNVFMNMRWGQMIDAQLLGYFRYGNINIPANYNYWTPNNPSNDFPQPNITGNSNDEGLKSLSIVDGSYMKIKNITLGYTLPKNISEILKIENLRIYGTVSNPFIFAKSSLLKDIDPETKGSDSFPLYKQVVFGVNLSF
ncbi:MAG TPA: SusC/RagA family TonB-linked outer membrane protein, partial [Marinilabiliaceae bacterium]|nr:SusC/RagA family TonB-linked outer membrane protein [Marinilabiliaceae bacterium]